MDSLELLRRATPPMSVAEGAAAIAELPDEALDQSDDHPDAGPAEVDDEPGVPAEAPEGAEPAETEPRDDTASNGETVELPLADGGRIQLSVDALAEAYKRTGSYQREAAERRQADEQVAQLTALSQDTQQQLLLQLQAAEALLRLEEPSAELAARDPGAYVRERQAWEARRGQLQAVQAQQQTMLQQQMLAAAQARHQQAATAQAVLQRDWPELYDEADGARHRQEVARKARDYYGLQAADMADVVDHRAWLVLRDALKYRDMLGRRPAVKPAQAQPAVLAPGGRPGDGSAQRARIDSKAARLRRSGDLADAAALFAELDI